MKLINREIDALIEVMQEELTIKRKEEILSFKKNTKVLILADSLHLEYSKMSRRMQKVIYPHAIKNYDFWVSQSILFLKLKPKTPSCLPSNTRRDIILASADSATIEEVLVKLKLKK
jgi:hypothetical protein